MSNQQLEMGQQKGAALSIKNMVLIAAFIALSAVGSFIKIPSPVGTIGLDSAPGYFIALALGGMEGALVIALGHLLTAFVTGFPLTIPVHLFIALQMALWAAAFRWVEKKLGIIAACVTATLLNGVLSSFTMLFAGGMGAAIAVMPFLAIASAINVIIAALVFRVFKKSKLV